MKTQLPIESRFRFPNYADAADYTAKTGRHPSWNPALPERHWESLGAPGPFFCIPDKQGDPLFEFKGDPTYVNIPAKPFIAPWSAPLVDVKVDGVPIADPFFATASERDALVVEINNAADANGSRRLVSFWELPGFGPAMPYTFGPGEVRRNWQAKDASGKIYCVGELIAIKNRIGASTAAAPTGAWTYTETGWFWKLRPELTADSIPSGTAGVLRPCLEIRAGEAIVWANTIIPGEQNLVVEVEVNQHAGVDASLPQLDRIEAKLDLLLNRE